ncbi:Leucine-rich repeat containing protein, putative [Theobroma cacao]|uniref:Leucine-rich repeat containing protein, putative n=1 Tax=Theobroma cacao TaxID=3641 RepID=A0A061DJ83_THECC|nr:Leucine-rich repeat containing protein, putative [Theobroma cacao]
MDSFASSIVTSILAKVGTSAYQQIISAWGIEDEMRKLRNTLEEIQAVLNDAEERQVKDEEQELRIWLRRFKDVLHNVEDVLDDFEIQDLQTKMLVDRGTTLNKVRNFFSSSNSLAFRFKTSQKIEKIWERLDEIKTSKERLKLSKAPKKETGIQRARETHSYVDAPAVTGRDDDKENIIQSLLQPDDHDRSYNNVSVISIVGLGGLGKTTLAKLVCNDERVRKHFDLNMWVCVSEEFDVITMTKEILKSTKAGLLGYDESNFQKWQEELRHALKDKKFLLVLDDVWNDNPRKWDELNQLLIGRRGSKILVTTRSQKVVKAMKSQVKYELGSLSHDDCLSLFLRWAYIEGQKERHQTLVEIGNEIVKKCKGNPLAAKTLGSLLSLTTNEKDWQNIRDNEIWELEQKEDDIMPVLKLSYNRMPPYLRSCFAYCAVFPKDFKFNSVDLIQLWLANGLITPYKNSEVEYVGMQYLKELFGRCFFEDVEEYVFVYTFKMHDLMHDLALSVAQKEFLTVDFRANIIPESVRHLSLFNSNLFQQKLKKPSQKKLRKTLRTILCPLAVLGSICESDVGSFIMGCKYLWVLDLSSSSFEELPSSIGRLKHLRYFSLSGNRRIRRLPNSVCKLQKLQALGLVGCRKLERLPKGVRNLISLRFLEFTTNEELLPNEEIGCLDSVQVLSISGCQYLRFLFEDMKQLTALRTSSITDCNWLRRLPCSVNDLTALENLIISNCADLDLKGKEDANPNQDEKVCSLRSITITKMTTFMALPQWLQRSANTLSCIIIEDCPNFKSLPEWLNNFKSLQKLQIKRCPQFPYVSELSKLEMALVPKVYVDDFKLEPSEG